MNLQLLRIAIAGIVAIVSILAVTSLALRGDAIPDGLRFVMVGSIGYVFGVSTNGSGIGIGKGGGGGA